MSDEEKTKVKDKSNDKKYFIVTPRLVWALCDDPYEYTFWSIIKDVAGEDGECILSRDDMATLAMMSGGKASQCRNSLIAKKLLEGELRRDPGYPQAVWHLTIPDFWEANIQWARKYISLKDRISYKRERKAEKEPSPHDDLSPRDGGGTPRDERMSPGDTKKNVLEEPKEESIKDSLLEIISSIAWSVFGNDMTTWWNVRRRLEQDCIHISGDQNQRPNPGNPMKIVISGLKERKGQFSEADVWEGRFYRSFANLGLDITFTE